MEEQLPIFQVADLVATVNQTLEYSLPMIQVIGEVSNFKVNQNKYVFFDLKDEEATVNCFMMKFKLRQMIEDGMKVLVTVRPNLTKWGKFSLTVEAIKPFGEGSLKKARELLLMKLEKEGLLSVEHKRPLPTLPVKIGVIGAIDSAGMADFKRIVNERWCGLEIVIKNSLVQGERAPIELIEAIDYFNNLTQPPELIAILRGGGSKDDLACFDDEALARVIFASKIPIITGIGHEIDVSVADLVADKYVATPTHLAQTIVPDKQEFKRHLGQKIDYLSEVVKNTIEIEQNNLSVRLEQILSTINVEVNQIEIELAHRLELLESFNPEQVLSKGYGILRGELKLQQLLEIETKDKIIKAEIKEIYDKKN